jgi:hypothetical protein
MKVETGPGAAVQGPPASYCGLRRELMLRGAEITAELGRFRLAEAS